MVLRKSTKYSDYGGVGKWLKTPVGWARANLILAKGDLPEYGTLLEAMCLLVWKENCDIMLAQTRATAQASLGGDKAAAAFKDFSNLLNRTVVEKKKDVMRERLEKIKKIKMIKFRPIIQGPKKGARSLKKVRR